MSDELLKAYKKIRELLIRAVADAQAKAAAFAALNEQYLELLSDRDALAAAIRRHRDAKGQERCWLDDDYLYGALGEPIPERPLPPRDCFLKGCERFYDNRDFERYTKLRQRDYLADPCRTQPLSPKEVIRLQELNEYLNGQADTNPGHPELLEQRDVARPGGPV